MNLQKPFLEVSWWVHTMFFKKILLCDKQSHRHLVMVKTAFCEANLWIECWEKLPLGNWVLKTKDAAHSCFQMFIVSCRQLKFSHNFSSKSIIASTGCKYFPPLLFSLVGCTFYLLESKGYCYQLDLENWPKYCLLKSVPLE